MATLEKKHVKVSSIKLGTWVTLGFLNAEIGEEMSPARVSRIEGGKVTFVMFGTTMFQSVGDTQGCTLTEIEKKEVRVYEFAGDSDEINEIITRVRLRINSKKKALAELESAVNMPTPTT